MLTPPGGAQLVVARPDWSSDGHYLLYSHTNPDTRRDIWLLPEPQKAGGIEVRWTRKSNKIFYLTPDHKIMVAWETTTPELSAGNPQLVYQGSAASFPWKEIDGPFSRTI